MKKHNNGQGLVEYILITALMALASIAMFKVFRSDVSAAYKKAGEALVDGVNSATSSNSESHE